MLGYACAEEFLAINGAETFSVFVGGVEEVKSIRKELLDNTIVRGYETRLFC